MSVGMIIAITILAVVVILIVVGLFKILGREI